MNKLVDTLEQFLREIISVQEMFDRCKANPPLTRNQPPVAGEARLATLACACFTVTHPDGLLIRPAASSVVLCQPCTSFDAASTKQICFWSAGAISWSHQLFSRVKLTMTKLSAVESEGTWCQLPVGQQVHERYTALAKQVLQFEKQWFQGWRDNVDNATMRYLKQPIFTRQPNTGECDEAPSWAGCGATLAPTTLRLLLLHAGCTLVHCGCTLLSGRGLSCVRCCRQGCCQLPP